MLVLRGEALLRRVVQERLNYDKETGVDLHTGRYPSHWLS